MKIETQEQARQVISEYYQSIGQPEPKIGDVQVIHSDSAIATIRYHVISSPQAITIKIVGSSSPTLVQ